MRLYLSSFRIGDCPERLLALAGDGRRVAVVGNAMDAAPAKDRREGVEREREALADLGFAPDEVDLRDHFGDPSGLPAVLGGYDVLWVRGGNVFVLRWALARSGAAILLPRLLAEDALVYAGYSAGPCVLAPSLRGLETVDPPDHVVLAYGPRGPRPLWDGLGVLDHAIVPHVDSPGHPESAGLGLVAERYRATGVPHRTMRDGEVLVVAGGRSEVCGAAG